MAVPGLRVMTLPSAAQRSIPPGEIGKREAWTRFIFVLFLLFIFLVGIRGMGTGFKGLGKEALHTFFHQTENPFMGLVVGILATTLVQSSSVTTSMIVALVAAPENPLPVANAIPMIMGANIGTTVTNTVVSLGHMGHAQEFKRAFAAATCHDFFNFLVVAVLLPLEIMTGFLSQSSHVVAGFVGSLGGGGKMSNPLKVATKAALEPVQSLSQALNDDQTVATVLLIVMSAGIIFGSLGAIVRTLRVLAATRMQTYITRSLDSSAVVAIIVGAVVTVMVQSSSITTSVLVPMAGAGIITLRQAFPVTLGSNIGTTVTALLASMAAPAETAHLAIQIAIVHLLVNLTGMALVYPVEAIREIPLKLAEKLAALAVRSRSLALVYVLLLFYGLPALLIFVSRMI